MTSYSISFQDLLKWLKRNHYCLPLFTVGGSNHFEVHYIDDTQIFIEGSKNAGIIVNNQLWQNAMDHMNRLPLEEQLKAQSFNMNNFRCPEMQGKAMYGPNFPAICKAYWAYHKK